MRRRRPTTWPTRVQCAAGRRNDFKFQPFSLAGSIAWHYLWHHSQRWAVLAAKNLAVRVMTAKNNRQLSYVSTYGRGCVPGLRFLTLRFGQFASPYTVLQL